MRYHDDTFVNKAFEEFLANVDVLGPLAFSRASNKLFSRKRKKQFSKLVADYENGEVKI